MADTNGRTRSYVSEVRAGKAARTRRLILTAAAGCFTHHGYRSTTMASIALAAEVSVESVKAAGSKADLLLRSFEQTFAGDEGTHPLGERPQMRDIVAIADPSAMLSAMIGFVADANRRSYGLWQTVVAAADQDPAVKRALDDLLGRRRRDILGAAYLLSARGLLAPGADIVRAADSWNYLLSPEGYEQLVTQSGWGFDDYVAWVHRAVTALVLPGP